MDIQAAQPRQLQQYLRQDQSIGHHHHDIRLPGSELRKDFRSFRTDRVMNADYLDEKYPERRDILRARWRQSMVWERPKDT